jgi:hypothetical protein
MVIEIVDMGYETKGRISHHEIESEGLINVS